MPARLKFLLLLLLLSAALLKPGCSEASFVEEQAPPSASIHIKTVRHLITEMCKEHDIVVLPVPLAVTAGSADDWNRLAAIQLTNCNQDTPAKILSLTFEIEAPEWSEEARDRGLFDEEGDPRLTEFKIATPFGISFQFHSNFMRDAEDRVTLYMETREAPSLEPRSDRVLDLVTYDVALAPFINHGKYKTRFVDVMAELTGQRRGLSYVVLDPDLVSEVTVFP